MPGGQAQAAEATGCSVFTIPPNMNEFIGFISSVPWLAREVENPASEPGVVKHSVRQLRDPMLCAPFGWGMLPHPERTWGSPGAEGSLNTIHLGYLM